MNSNSSTTDIEHLVIAIDGPAASGKGTLARRLAETFGLPHLDTGLIYRATAKSMLDSGAALDDELAAVEAAKSIDLAKLDRAVLSAHDISDAASQISVMAGVRAALLEVQRNFANTPPGAVLDGRDIGTNVCPNADVKIYVTASAETRAERRYREVVANGGSTSYVEIYDDLKKRDYRDSNRSENPLKPAENAHLLDTSKMDIETAFLAATTWVKKAQAARNRD